MENYCLKNSLPSLILGKNPFPKTPNNTFHDLFNNPHSHTCDILDLSL